MLVSGLCQNNKIKIVRAASVKFDFFCPCFVFQMPKLQFYIYYAMPNAPQNTPNWKRHSAATATRQSAGY
ncbi:unnamed protein product [Tenebrio molitor]|nr:unnamed protein product [Tenebrio molitor]